MSSGLRQASPYALCPIIVLSNDNRRGDIACFNQYRRRPKVMSRRDAWARDLIDIDHFHYHVPRITFTINGSRNSHCILHLSNYALYFLNTRMAEGKMAHIFLKLESRSVLIEMGHIAKNGLRIHGAASRRQNRA